MTRTIPLIIGIAITALAVAVPTAFAKGQPVDSPRVAQLLLEKNGTVDRSIVGERFQQAPQWQQALMARSEAMNQKYLPDQSSPIVVGERFQQAPQWQQALSARSEALNQQYQLGEYAVSSVDARERALTAKSEAQMASTPYPDWFERAANAAIRDNRGVVVVDDRFNLHPKDISATVTPTSSGREIDYPQVGIGLGLGVLLALGLYLTVRYTRIRPVAH